MENNENSESILERKHKKNKQKKRDRKHYSSGKVNYKFSLKSLPVSKNYLINMNRIEKSLTSSDINSIDENYQKDLYNKFMRFLDKKKFKISNKFDEKHSKKFLDSKNKCLEKIILSDIIENTTNDLKSKKTLCENSKHDYESKRLSFNVNRKFRTEKNINKYFIVITNYDEEIKSRNSKKF